MPSAITLRASVHIDCGPCRTSARSSIQAISSCARWARTGSSAAGAKPTVAKPSARASATNRLFRSAGATAEVTIWLLRCNSRAYHAIMGLGDGVGTGNLAIEARGLVKRFAGALAIDGLDLAVPEGAIYGVLGPNGAGKTTTLRILLGIIEPDEGERRLLGHADPHRIARRIGYLPEERGLYPSMKAYDAIAFMGALRGLPLAEGRRRGRELLEANGLGHAAERQIRQLSKGMAQQVQLLGTLVHQPRLVILDEPFAGLDAINQGKLERLIRSLAEKGTTVIFSTHVIAH